jgi:hypothetical protein
VATAADGLGVVCGKPDGAEATDFLYQQLFLKI